MKSVSRDDAERRILERFLAAYQKHFGVELKDVHHRDKPDFEVTNPVTNEKIGVEITGVYQNKREAIIQYGLSDNEEWFTGSTAELLKSLNVRLANKAEKVKSYNFDGQIWLVILFGSLVFNQKFDIDFIRKSVAIPENGFSKIWLIIRDKDDYSPELYPLQG